MHQEITLREVQELMSKYYLQRDRERGVYATFTWLIEEIGELAESILNKNKKAQEDEIADVLAWLASLANLLSIDLEKAFKQKYLNPQPP
ncbi:MAG: MazG nucleotide pyrophosphohydrolase domain-containing protein [Desulfurococcaceae archaeon TW002]